MSHSEKNVQEEEKSKIFTFILQRRGTGYGLIIGILGSIQQLVGKKLSLDYGLGQILFTRFIIQAFLCTIFNAIARNSFVLVNRREIIFVSAKSICFHIGVLTLNYSFQCIPYADSISIVYGATTVMVIILGRIFLEEVISCCTIVLSVMMVLGIVLTSQPSFIFHKFSDNPDPLSTLMGSCFAIGSAIAFAFSSVICRKIQLTHSTTLAFYISLWGIIIEAITIGSTLLFRVPDNIIDIALFVFSGILSFIYLNVWSKGFQIGNVTEVTLAMQVDTPLCYLLDFLVIHVTPNWLSVVGAFEISICIIILTMQDNLFKCYVTTCKKYDEIPESDEINKETV